MWRRIGTRASGTLKLVRETLRPTGLSEFAALVGEQNSGGPPFGEA